MKKIRFPKNIFYKFISILMAVSSVIFLNYLFYLDLLPTKYLSIITIFVLIFTILNIFLVNKKNVKKKTKKIFSIFMVIAIICINCANFYIGKTIEIFLDNSDNKYKLQHYSVIVLKDSEYKEISDIKDKEVGYFINSVAAKEATETLQEDIDVTFKEYDSVNRLVNDLLYLETDVIILEDSIKTIISEEMESFEDYIKVIHKFTIKTEEETVVKEVNVSMDSFAVYISGIDTYGEISSVSRSDVNIVMVVNPNTHQILLISIPRDYYVQLHGTTGSKDKLTHAGIYGIDMSIQTIEDLLELDINYYLKVNFTSVIDIVDTLGGLELYSEYSFTSYSGYIFKKGINLVNGEQALDFARTRKAFIDGDRQRGKNQQALIKAIIDKSTDKSIITKYSSLLDSINGKYQTNMSLKTITALVKKQLNDFPTWNIHSYSLTGKDSTDYTYTYNQLLYVMKPDEDSVDHAIKLIDSIIAGEELESSYTDSDTTVNKVIQVEITPEIKLEEELENEEVTNEDVSIESGKEVDENINVDNLEQEPGLELPEESDGEKPEEEQEKNEDDLTVGETNEDNKSPDTQIQDTSNLGDSQE